MVTARALFICKIAQGLHIDKVEHRFRLFFKSIRNVGKIEVYVLALADEENAIKAPHSLRFDER